MLPETTKRLLDARKACRELEQFTDGQTGDTFLQNRGLQLIVHKLLEIVGEALNGAKRNEPLVTEQIPNMQRFVSLRNQITHGYDTVDYRILWAVSQQYIPDLAEALDELIGDAPPASEM